MYDGKPETVCLLLTINKRFTVFEVEYIIYIYIYIAAGRRCDYGGCDYGERDHGGFYGECDYGGFYGECDYGECDYGGCDYGECDYGGCVSIRV